MCVCAGVRVLFRARHRVVPNLLCPRVAVFIRVFGLSPPPRSSTHEIFLLLSFFYLSYSPSWPCGRK